MARRPGQRQSSRDPCRFSIRAEAVVLPGAVGCVTISPRARQIHHRRGPAGYFASEQPSVFA
jgi:hypothetical protein